MNPTIPASTWHERIRASRRRRERYEKTWEQNARLFTKAYQAVREANEDETVVLPSGDQVKLSLIFRNIEQTRAMLDIPEIGVRAEAQDFTREMGREDSHRESVVETALVRSMENSSLLDGEEVADQVKWDGMICGHAVSYGHWRLEEEEVEVGTVQVLEEGDDGTFVPVMDEDGFPLFEPETQMQTIWEGVQDQRVSPLYFLFDSEAPSIHGSPWHGFESIMALEELRKDGRYDIPGGISGTAYKRRDFYGEQFREEELTHDSVKVIIVYDKRHRELIHFLEYSQAEERQTTKNKRRRQKRQKGDNLVLHTLLVEKKPVEFSHPDRSPFSFFIPIPANDYPFGIDQVEHIRNPALEADKLRTRMANLTRQLKLILMYRNGRLDQDQLATAINNPSTMPVGVILEEGENWQDLLHEVKLGGIPKEVYDQVRMAIDDVTETSGIPETPFTGADTATESENQMAIGGARPQRKRRLYLKYLTECARCHFDFLRTFAPPGESISVVGVDGTPLNLTYGREAFQGKFKITAQAGGGATAISPVKQKMLLEFGDRVGGRFGPKFDLILLRQAMTMFDIRDQNALMRAASEGLGLSGAGGPMALGQQRPEVNLNDISNGQTIRAAINAPNESPSV